MSKKFYWLKLKDDFFNQREIKKLRRIAGGDTYTIIYQKLLLLSLKNEGKIYFDGVEDDFVEEMALELDEMVDNVRMTILYLQKHDLIEQRSDNEFYMTRLEESIGSESESAERVRRMRARKSILGVKSIDEARYGGNGQKVLERDNYCCVVCSSNKNICIHHKNGSSNEMADLITLCRKCHSNQHVTCNTLTVTCNDDVTKCNTEIEKEIEIELNKNIEQFFESLWTLYPNKKGKGKVSKTQKKKLYKLGEEVLIKCIDRYKNDKEDWKEWQHGSSFFNKGYIDYVDGNYVKSPRVKVVGKVEQRSNFNQRDYDDMNVVDLYSNVKG